jgi:hypothetical protein
MSGAVSRHAAARTAGSVSAIAKVEVEVSNPFSLPAVTEAVKAVY